MRLKNWMIEWTVTKLSVWLGVQDSPGHIYCDVACQLTWASAKAAVGCVSVVDKWRETGREPRRHKMLARRRAKDSLQRSQPMVVA